MASCEENKKTVTKYVEAFNAGDYEALRALFSPDAVVRGVLGWGGLDLVMPIWKELHEGLAVELSVEEMIAEGDIVAVRYAERGKSVEKFRGNAPTGKTYELVAMEWFEMREGKIHRRWGARDAASQARQLGFHAGP